METMFAISADSFTTLYGKDDMEIDGAQMTVQLEYTLAHVLIALRAVAVVSALEPAIGIITTILRLLDA
jgi:hypothetical protein